MRVGISFFVGLLLSCLQVHAQDPVAQGEEESAPMEAPAGVQTTVGSDPSLSIPLIAEFRLPAPRGDILSLDGVPYATTGPSTSLLLHWPHLANPTDAELIAALRPKIDQIADILGKPIHFPDEDLISSYRLRRFLPLVIADQLTSEQIRRFEKAELSRDEWELQSRSMRTYPEGNKFAHGVGYIKRAQIQNSGAYRNGEVYQDEYQGAYGLERYFDKELTGKDGFLTVTTTADGLTDRIKTHVEPTPGLNLRTTLDSRVQTMVESAMDPIRQGAAVVLDVNNGDVVAMVSRPTFDPNDFLPILTPEYWKKVSTDPHLPLLNRTYRGTQPPGSIFKVITAVASMKARVFDPDWVLDCTGKLQVGDMTYEFPKETTSVHFRDALTYSCNTYFMTLGLKTGREILIQTAKEFGVGELTGIMLPSERPGLMPDPDFVRQHHHRIMGSGDVANSSIGQGDVLVTPLQAANWIAAVANGGTLYRPRMVKQLENPDGTVAREFPTEIIRHIDIPEEGLRQLQKDLEEVVVDGTGYPARVPNLRLAAKTGTAQVGSKEKPRQIAWMNGYVPADHPQYAFAVMIEGSFDEDLHGGDHAGAVVGNILSRLYAVPATVPSN